MDLDRSPELPKRPTYAKGLIRRCHKLASILSDGLWELPEGRKVSMSRSYHETLGDPPTKDSQSSMPVLTMVTRADFEAEKDTVGSFAAGEDGTVQEMEAFLCETYTLTVSVRESVAAAELPEWIRSQIGEGVAASDGEDNNEDSIVAIAEPDVEFLGAFEYEREMEVTYIASSEDGGELNDHIIEYRFYCEGQEIDKMRYSWVESMQTFESSALFDDISEMKRNDLGEITQDEICDIQEKFDSIIETIVVDKQFDDMEAIDDETGGLYLNEAEHCRRALGMLALVSRHIAGMRFRYPQSIDAEAVET